MVNRILLYRFNSYKMQCDLSCNDAIFDEAVYFVSKHKISTM